MFGRVWQLLPPTVHTLVSHSVCLDAVAEHHGLGGLNSGRVCLAVLGAGKSEIEVPAGLGSGEGPLSDLLVAALLLYSHSAERVRGQAVWSLLTRALISA